MAVTLDVNKTINEGIPQLFQDNLMCAGVNNGIVGACEGDSGGPLMYKDEDLEKYIQIGTVRGAVGSCGNKDYPGIFVRVDHPSIWQFISSIIQTEKDPNKGKNQNVMFTIKPYIT
jgi:secreted trypsin-like serine protease